MTERYPLVLTVEHEPEQAELYRRALRKQRKQNAVRSFAILSIVIGICILTWYLEGHHG